MGQNTWQKTCRLDEQIGKGKSKEGGIENLEGCQDDSVKGECINKVYEMKRAEETGIQENSSSFGICL